MIFSVIFLITSVFSQIDSTGNFSDMFPKQEKISDCNKIMMQIMDQSNKTIGLKYNIQPIGFGMSPGLKHISISFQKLGACSKDEARIMLIDCAEIFLKNINSNTEISPFLEDLPYTIKNVGIIIYVSDECENDLYHPDICVASWNSMNVYFHTDDPEKQYTYKETYEETHEEALELVRQYRATSQHEAGGLKTCP